MINVATCREVNGAIESWSGPVCRQSHGANFPRSGCNGLCVSICVFAPAYPTRVHVPPGTVDQVQLILVKQALWRAAFLSCACTYKYTHHHKQTHKLSRMQRRENGSLVRRLLCACNTDKLTICTVDSPLVTWFCFCSGRRWGRENAVTFSAYCGSSFLKGQKSRQILLDVPVNILSYDMFSRESWHYAPAYTAQCVAVSERAMSSKASQVKLMKSNTSCYNSFLLRDRNGEPVLVYKSSFLDKCSTADNVLCSFHSFKIDWIQTMWCFYVMKWEFVTRFWPQKKTRSTKQILLGWSDWQQAERLSIYGQRDGLSKPILSPPTVFLLFYWQFPTHRGSHWKASSPWFDRIHRKDSSSATNP